LRFVVDLKLPKNVQTISLSYALFDVTHFAAVERPSPQPVNRTSI
jgi:cytochrome c oxidase assembly protein Cox11